MASKPCRQEKISPAQKHNDWLDDPRRELVSLLTDRRLNNTTDPGARFSFDRTSQMGQRDTDMTFFWKAVWQPQRVNLRKLLFLKVKVFDYNIVTLRKHYIKSLFLRFLRDEWFSG